MNVGSLFSGIGGIELGFEREGFKTEWFVENNPFCQAVLRKHWPNTPIYGDITTIDFTKLPKVDIITGGFPCQDISIAGKGKGIIEGKRSSLWKEFHRAIGEIRPKYALIENVSALTFRGLCNVLADLAEIRYDAEWFCLSAQDVGAPHKRERIFIVAYSDNSRCVHRQDEIEPTETWKHAQCESKSSREEMADTTIRRLEKQGLRQELQSVKGSKTMAHSNNERLQGPQAGNDFKIWKPERPSGCGSIATFKQINKQEIWATDAGILRVANGIPNRIHRIKSLGNAVVPQCAQFIARQIKEAEGL